MNTPAAEAEAERGCGQLPRLDAPQGCPTGGSDLLWHLFKNNLMISDPRVGALNAVSLEQTPQAPDTAYHPLKVPSWGFKFRSPQRTL